MVNWDRVEELRSKGWDWERIADDPKVGFHPEASVHEPGRALRGLYHRQRSRERRERPAAASRPKKAEEEQKLRRWNLTRIGMLLTPIVGIWFTVAYLVPSPVGLVVPALPYLALGLAVAAFLLVFGLWRSEGPRWSKPLRATLITGIVLGLVVSGLIAVGGFLTGCPYLPSASTGTTEPAPGWIHVNVKAWEDGGHPVFYYYGATWCPYCSASSWAMWDALRHFGSASPTPPAMGYSAEDGIPYVDLASGVFTLTSSSVTLQVSEDTSGVTGTFPATSNCVQQAYFGAYGGTAIPFVVINGQYVHGGSSLIPAASLSTWANGGNGGYTTVYQSVVSETGTPWSVVQGQTWWMMAFLVKATGTPVSQLAAQYHWSATTTSQVTGDVAALR